MYASSKLTNKQIIHNNPLGHQPSNSSTGMTSGNYRKFQHRRMFTQTSESNGVSSKFQYNNPKYHVYGQYKGQQYGETNVLKKDYSRNIFLHGQKFPNAHEAGQNIRNPNINNQKINHNLSSNKFTNNLNHLANMTTNNQESKTYLYQNPAKQSYKIVAKPKYFKTQGNDDVQEKAIPVKNKVYKHICQNSKYEIEDIAGRGTFGVVYFGRMAVTGQKIALKKVLQDKKYKNRELEIMKEISHPNILKMKDYFFTTQDEEEYLNVVMDYYSDSLYQIIKRKQLTPLMIKLYSYQILRGLNYLTNLSISHRDIKPQNILVDRNSHKVVICDFGSAKRLVRGESNISYICSRCYRAPELIFGAAQYTSQIDIWSAGCVIAQMINGEAPFVGNSQIDQLLEILKVLGTPQEYEIVQMNPKYDLKEYKKFPNLKKISLRKILKTQDPLLIDLMAKMLQYSPKRRLAAAQALNHPYFDELKELSEKKDLQYLQKMRIKIIPDLFDFTQYELASLQLNQDKQKRLIVQNMENI